MRLRFQHKLTDILVLVGVGDAFAIPKRCCDVDEWKNLCEMVRARLGDPAGC